MAKDRNQEAREEFAQRQARKQFLDAVNSGAAAIRDRFGRPIRVGGKVAYSSYLPLIGEVISVDPDLRPNTQPGVMKLVLAVPVEQFVMANQPLAQLITIATSAPSDEQQPPADGPREGDEPPPIMPPADAPTDYDAPPTGDGDEHGTPPQTDPA